MVAVAVDLGAVVAVIEALVGSNVMFACAQATLPRWVVVAQAPARRRPATDNVCGTVSQSRDGMS